MKGRAQKAHEAAAEPGQANGAFSEEAFAPAQVNVVSPDLGQPGALQLRFFVGQLASNLFSKAFVANLDPDVAIAIANEVIKEARLMKSGLVLGSAANLPQAG